MEEAVVDANVFLHGRGDFPFEKALTVQEVVDEVESFKGRNVLENLDYEVRGFSEKSLERVVEKSDEINSPTSEADEKLVALALDQDKILVTDDIALQNLALHLEVEFKAFVEDELDEKQRWEKLCGNCGKEVSTPPCPRCGSRQVRRKQVRCS